MGSIGVERVELLPVATCSIEGCDREHAARGWCLMHYKRWRNRGTTDPLVRSRARDRVCTIDGCDRPQRARGWCNKHWQRWRFNGDPLYLPPQTMPIADRLLHYTQKTEACWLWEGTLNPAGYGHVCWVDFDTPFVHRIAYMIWVGPIEEGLEIDHLCSVRNCIRPEHLEAVTQLENTRRKWRRYHERKTTSV